MGFSSGHLIFLGGSLHQERENPWAITHTEAVPEEFKSFQLIGQHFLSEKGNTVSLSELDCKQSYFFENARKRKQRGRYSNEKTNGAARKAGERR